MKAEGIDLTWNAETKTATFTMPAYNVELEVEYDDITTAIISIKNGQADSVTYYDLQGRRVAQPTRSATTGDASTIGLKKGIYFFNGKKVVIK